MANVPLATWALGVDVGGTQIKSGLVGQGGGLRDLSSRSTPQPGGGRPVADLVVDHVAREVAARAIGPDRIAGVGLVVPGLVNETDGIASYSANLGWRDVPLRRMVEDRVNLPVAFAHDVRAGAVAEGSAGAGRGCSDFLFVTLGTGVGAAVTVAGQLYAGATFSGGEFGHVVVDEAGHPCACGRRGCLETLASGSGMLRRFAERAGSPVGDVSELLRLVEQGNAHAVAVWEGGLEALALALANYVILLDPALIVVGGGISNAGDMLFGPLADLVGRSLACRSSPRIVPGEFGSAAGCVGAGLLSWKMLAA